MTKQTALVTGASSGIGLDYARVLAREGCNLVFVARSGDKLNSLAAELKQKHGTETLVVAQDLGIPGAAQQVYDAVENAGLTVDILINNAGFASYGVFHEADVENELQMIQLNIAALTHLTRLFLPGMVARKYGRITNVASTAAFQPGPLMAVYYATKAYVLSFSEAIANELQGTGVTVTALCPGPTESGFQARAAMQDSKLVQNGRGAMGMMDSMTVVEIGYKGMMAGKTVVVPGLPNQIGALAPRFVPRPLVTRIVRNMQERAEH